MVMQISCRINSQIFYHLLILLKTPISKQFAKVHNTEIIIHSCRGSSHETTCKWWNDTNKGACRVNRSLSMSDESCSQEWDRWTRSRKQGLLILLTISFLCLHYYYGIVGGKKTRSEWCWGAKQRIKVRKKPLPVLITLQLGVLSCPCMCMCTHISSDTHTQIEPICSVCSGPCVLAMWVLFAFGQGPAQAAQHAPVFVEWEKTVDMWTSVFIKKHICLSIFWLWEYCMCVFYDCWAHHTLYIIQTRLQGLHSEPPSLHHHCCSFVLPQHKPSGYPWQETGFKWHCWKEYSVYNSSSEKKNHNVKQPW